MLLGGILISGVLSRAVLTGIELKFDLPEHIFAEQPILAEIELRNEKQSWPSFSLLVVGQAKRNKTAAEILTRPVFFPYIPHMSASRQKVELRFPRRGAYRQDAFGIRTRFPFGFFEKTRASRFRYRDRRLSARRADRSVLRSSAAAERRNGQPFSGARARTPFAARLSADRQRALRRLEGHAPKPGRMMVREFAREDERRVMLVLDPFIGLPRRDLGRSGRRRACGAFRARRLDGRVHRVALPRDSLGDAVPHAMISSPRSHRRARSSTTRCASSRCSSRRRRQPAARFSTSSSTNARFSRSSSPRGRSGRSRARCGPPRISFSSTSCRSKAAPLARLNRHNRTGFRTCPFFVPWDDPLRAPTC